MKKAKIWVVYETLHGFRHRLGTVRAHTEHSAKNNASQRFKRTDIYVIDQAELEKAK